MSVLAAAARWAPAPVPASTAGLVAAGYADWLAPLLARRGVETPAAAERFLHPSLADLHDPLALSGMSAAVARLRAVRDAAHGVVIVGDYDVDGVTGTALLLAVLRKHGFVAEAILPHRVRDGYGFQPVHVERALALGARQIVTVDCGTSAVAAAQAALDAGLGVIVTDHHVPGVRLPEGVIQINPWQAECSYPCRHLSGAGLALKLAQAVSAACGLQESGAAVDATALLRLACLGTIADLVPLAGENRAIAALGLKALPATRSAGLQALMRQAGVSAPLSAADVGYRLGPRLNAAGRLDDPTRALDLLLTRDRAEAERLAESLEKWNRERQDEEARVVEEAREAVLARPVLPAVLVAWSASWHRGVVGIAAGRLAREFHRPTLLLAEADGECVGSGRSVSGIDLHAFLSPWQEELVRFGGHAQAVGLTVDAARLPRLCAAWEAAGATWPAELLSPCHEYELHLPAQAANRALLQEMGRLEPHGMGNPRPLLRLGPLRRIGSPRLFGRGHLSLTAAGEGGATVGLLGWGWAERAAEFDGSFDALGHLEEDRYRGDAVLRLVDVRPAGTDPGEVS